MSIPGAENALFNVSSIVSRLADYLPIVIAEKTSRNSVVSSNDMSRNGCQNSRIYIESPDTKLLASQARLFRAVVKTS